MHLYVYLLNYLFLRRVIFFKFWSQMWDHIINIHSSELLRTKTKKSRTNKHKKIKIKKDNLHFLSNNILTRLFKELKKKRMIINNI